jgi:hypothetical protein
LMIRQGLCVTDWFLGLFLSLLVGCKCVPVLLSVQCTATTTFRPHARNRRSRTPHHTPLARTTEATQEGATGVPASQPAESKFCAHPQKSSDNAASATIPRVVLAHECNAEKCAQHRNFWTCLRKHAPVQRTTQRSTAHNTAATQPDRRPHTSG